MTVRRTLFYGEKTTSLPFLFLGVFLSNSLKQIELAEFDKQTFVNVWVGSQTIYKLEELSKDQIQIFFFNYFKNHYGIEIFELCLVLEKYF